jgi:hypothetical protein
MSGITPKPEGELEIINYDEFPNNILSKVGGKWEGFNMHLTKEIENQKLYFGIAKGWMVYALQTNTDIQFKWIYKSTDIITEIHQWEKI